MTRTVKSEQRRSLLIFYPIRKTKNQRCGVVESSSCSIPCPSLDSDSSWWCAVRQDLRRIYSFLSLCFCASVHSPDTWVGARLTQDHRPTFLSSIGIEGMISGLHLEWFVPWFTSLIRSSLSRGFFLLLLLNLREEWKSEWKFYFLEEDKSGQFIRFMLIY